jgi:predicted permease
LQGGNTVWIKVVGRPYNGEHNEVAFREVTPGYVSALQARIKRGRFFNDRDTASAPPVVIINHALARHYFAGDDPIGRQMLYASAEPQSTPMTIVGVVDDIKEGPMDEATRPTMYVAYDQDPTNYVWLFARMANAEAAMLPAIEASIREVDRAIPTFLSGTMREQIDSTQTAWLRRSSATVVGGFAAVACLLSVIGLYGVVAYSVSRRTREIGVRMALGAQPRLVFRQIVGEAGRLTAVGLVVGLTCAVAAAVLMRGLLFGIQPWDATTLAIVAVVLSGAAIVASAVPARRAASVNPLEALRAE